MSSLLKKYDIPINHLDFDYIKSCGNVQEIERIVTVLKSGEEGYYPDLTDCALAKLKALKPNSKIFREEAPVLNKQSMNNEEWNHITTNIDDWTETMKKNTEILREEKSADGKNDVFPIRQFCSKDSSEKESTKTNVKRIKSCDYAQWDKYDPEVEMLKMDINDERQCETVKVKNRKNVTSSDTRKTQQLADKLSTIEKVDLANKHRIKGNEFYKAADYDEAIREYSLSIQIHRTASAFNNRAITYFKLNNFDMTIADCEQCLRLEPSNVKALQRKAQALINQSKYREAYNECTKMLSIESNNEWAKNRLIEIKPKIPDLPPANAFRMKIVEDEGEQDDPSTDPTTEYDFASLIIPDKIYPSKLSKLKSNFVLNKNGNNTKKSKPEMKLKDRKGSAELIIPTHNSQSKSKITEYRNGVIIEEL